MAADAFDGIIYEWDARTDRVERSSGLFAITGFHPEEAEPSSNWWRSRIHPEDFRKRRRDFLAASRAGAPVWDSEYRVRHRDGSYRNFGTAHGPLYDEQGRPARIVGCTIDITEQRLADRCPGENERRFRKLADSNIIGIIFGDVHGGISYANDEFLRILGYSRGRIRVGRELVGRPSRLRNGSPLTNGPSPRPRWATARAHPTRRSTSARMGDELPCWWDSPCSARKKPSPSFSTSPSGSGPRRP